MKLKLHLVHSRYICLVLLAIMLTYSLAIQEGMCQPQLGPEQGPWNRDLYILESTNGLTFGNVRRFVERAGVPTVVRDEQDRLIAAFQWFPFDDLNCFDQVAVSFSHDNGRAWSRPRKVFVDGLPEGFMRPFDPTLVVLDDDRFRLYFSSHDRDNHIPATYSAISNDGVHYKFEPGIRFAIRGEVVIDCAVGKLGDTWHYFAPVQGDRGIGYHAISQDGLQYARAQDVEISGAGNWLGCVLPTNKGIRFYGTGRGIWSARSNNGVTWELEHGSRAPGADPAVATTSNGKLIMIVTGPPRPDAGPPPFPRAPRRPRP